MVSTPSARGLSPAASGVAVMGVVGATSSLPPPLAHCAMRSMVFWSRALEWTSATPSGEAGQGGMNLARVTTPMPSATADASAAVRNSQWAAPTWPGLWHEAQLCWRTGWTTRAKETVGPRGRAEGGGAVWGGAGV